MLANSAHPPAIRARAVLVHAAGPPRESTRPPAQRLLLASERSKRNPATAESARARPPGRATRYPLIARQAEKPPGNPPRWPICGRMEPETRASMSAMVTYLIFAAWSYCEAMARYRASAPASRIDVAAACVSRTHPVAVAMWRPSAELRRASTQRAPRLASRCGDRRAAPHLSTPGAISPAWNWVAGVRASSSYPHAADGGRRQHRVDSSG